MKYILVVLITVTLAGCQGSMLKKTRGMLAFQAELDLRQKKAPGMSDEKYAAELNSRHAELFGDVHSDYSKYDEGILRDLWQINDTLAFYTMSERYITAEEKLFEVFKKRNIEKTKCRENSKKATCVDDLFSAYIRTGDFAKAKLLKQEYQDILKEEFVPAVFDDPAVFEKSRKLYELVNGDGSLRLISLEPRNGPEIIAILSPGCHFSRTALEIIVTAPDLLEEFKKSTTIIFPINASLSPIPELEKWNNENPGLKYYLHSDNPAHLRGWEGLDFSSTPQFYFINEGKVVYQIGGWGPTKEKFLANLAEGIKKIRK